MLQDVYFLAKFGADTAENEQHFAEILLKIGNYPTGPPPPEGPRGDDAKPAAERPAKTQRGSLELMSLDVRHMFYKVPVLFLKFR